MKSSEIKKESFPVMNSSIESVTSNEINNSSPWRVFENKNQMSPVYICIYCIVNNPL
jgi:hypothetical protein